MYAFFSTMKKCVEQKTCFGDVYAYIAEYVLENHELVPSLKIDELAQACHTSTSTITRFCQKINHSSFRQFKEDCKGYTQFLKEKEMNIESLNRFHGLTLESYQQMCEEALKDTFEMVSTVELSKSTRWIEESKAIAFFGSSYSNFIAKSASDKFTRLGKHTKVFSTPADQLSGANELKGTDVAVVLSFSGKTEMILRILRLLQKKHVRVILISSNEKDFIKSTELSLLKVSSINLREIESPLIQEQTMMTMVNILYMHYFKMKY